MDVYATYIVFAILRATVNGASSKQEVKKAKSELKLRLMSFDEAGALPV